MRPKYLMRGGFSYLTNEVDNDQVEDNMGKNEVSKGSLARNILEHLTVLLVDLNTIWCLKWEQSIWIFLSEFFKFVYHQLTGKYKWCNSWNESSEEGIEWKGADQAAVDKLEDACEHDSEHVGIDQLEFAGGGCQVLTVQVGDHRTEVLVAGCGCWWWRHSCYNYLGIEIIL